MTCKKLSIFFLSLGVCSCIFAAEEPAINEFSPLRDRYRHCAAEQAELRTAEGNTLVMGRSESAYVISSACLASLEAEDSEITAAAPDIASRTVKMLVGAEYYNHVCKQPSFRYQSSPGREKSTWYNFTPNNKAYSYFEDERK